MLRTTVCLAALLLGVLFTLPIVIAVLGRRYDVYYNADKVENP